MAQWAVLQDCIKQAVTSAPTIVKLNVGGKIFETSKDTLLRVEGSYFHAWLGFGNWKPDDTANAYFLDMDPKLFRRVLFYLRTGTMMQEEGLTKAERDELKAMMEYLKVCPWEAGTQFIRWNTNIKSQHIAVSTDCQTVEMATSFSWGGVIATEALNGKVRLRLHVRANDVFLGVCPLVGFRCTSWNNSIQKCYGYHSDGFIHKMSKSQAIPQAKLRVGDVVAIQRCASSVEFTVNDGAPVRLKLVDPHEDLFPVVFMYSAGAKVTAVD